MEVELKLLIDPDKIESLRALPIMQQYAVESPHAQQMSSTYYDTPDMAIRQQDAGLRVRQVDGNWIQTLKAGGSVRSGLHSRHEWESKVSGPQPELASLQNAANIDRTWVKMLRSPGLAERLEPIFTTDVTRSIWLLRLKAGDEVEFALDEGSIQHQDKNIPISELEIELKSGAPEHLFDFALELMNSIPLRIGYVSKAERGYTLCKPHLPAIMKAKAIHLVHGLTVERGFKTIIANCLAHVQGNEAGVIEGHDPESVHQMRVGLRRLHSALKLFREYIPCEQGIIDELSWLATELGEARDWEVLLDSTLEKIADAVPSPGEVDNLKHATQDRVREKRDNAAAAVASARYAKLSLTFSAWLEGARWRNAMTDQDQKKLHASLDKFSRKILEQDQACLIKRGKRLPNASATARHRVRIAAKKTRYATEFFQSLYSPKQVRIYIGALSNLQDELGWMNDAVVADGLLRTFQGRTAVSSELAETASFVRGYLSARIDQDKPRLIKLWRRFSTLRAPARK